MPTAVPGARDPRDIITEDALQVAPELIGLPLARPWRRAAAIAIDGLLVAILANAPGALFGVAAALVLFRVSARRAANAGHLARSFRLMFRLAGAITLFVVVTQGWDSLSSRVSRGALASLVDEAAPDPDAAAEQGSTGKEVGVAKAIAAFRLAGEDQAHRNAAQLVSALRSEGEDVEEIGEVLDGLAASAPGRPWLRSVADSVIQSLDAPATPPVNLAVDSLVLDYAAALRAQQPARADTLRPLLASALAGDTLQSLATRIRELRAARSTLAARVDELEDEKDEQGLVALLRGLLDDLGLGFGWAGLYFTATVALFRGQTPGKRLLGIRIIRLNGKPIGWWAAFERFGGYAAGVATGLLGFLQIFWDRNRQAIHDKITETAVIRG